MSNKAARRVEEQRLVYYRSQADAAFWDTHWQAHLSVERYRGAECGRLGWLEPLVAYLPKQGRILEAGCGLGQYVLALRVRDYDAEGVEWGAETVQAVHTLYPDLPIWVGDVTRLEVPDGYYSGYISLGVVEHRQEGPEPFLKEAYRVLAPGGMALISVPYFHPLRRLKAWLELYRDQVDDLEFYQYAFTESEFAGFLREAGFKIVDRMPYDGFKGIKDELPWLRPILSQMLKWRGIGWRLRRWLRYSSLGHMLLVVCQKNEANR